MLRTRNGDGQRHVERRPTRTTAAANTGAATDRHGGDTGRPAAHAPLPPPAPRHAHLPADLQLLSDREIVETVRELLRDDGRIDMDELHISCRHGVVFVSGTLPSVRELQIVHKLLIDVEGLEEIVDHVCVNELPWERDDRVEPGQLSFDDLPSGCFENTLTHDALRAEQEGIAYDPPDEPPPDEG